MLYVVECGLQTWTQEKTKKSFLYMEKNIYIEAKFEFFSKLFSKNSKNLINTNVKFFQRPFISDYIVMGG